MSYSLEGATGSLTLLYFNYKARNVWSAQVFKGPWQPLTERGCVRRSLFTASRAGVAHIETTCT